MGMTPFTTSEIAPPGNEANKPQNQGHDSTKQYFHIPPFCFLYDIS